MLPCDVLSFKKKKLNSIQTSPWAWYFYSALPRALLMSLIFVPYAMKLDYRVRSLVYPAFGFISLYSFLPHKELRFIIYTIPLLNVAAARTCAHMQVLFSNSIFKTCLFLYLNNFFFFIIVCIWDFYWYSPKALTKYSMIMKIIMVYNVMVSNVITIKH